MDDSKEVEITSLSDEDVIDMIVEQTKQNPNGKDDEVTVEEVDAETIRKKDLLQLQAMINQSLMEQNERFKNEIDSLKSTFTPIKSFMEHYEQLEKYVNNSITELNGRMSLVEEEMNFVKQFKDANKFVLGNTFNKLSKKVLELEKQISTEKDIVAGKFNSLSNEATTDVNDSAAKHDAILHKVTSLNNRMQCLPSQIKQIADEKYYLAARIAKLEELYQHRSTVAGNESEVTSNVTPNSYTVNPN